MDLKEFKEKIDDYSNEIGIYGDEGFIGSHDIVGSIYVEDENGDTYEVEGFDISQMGGCGCWSGIIIKVKKDED